MPPSRLTPRHVSLYAVPPLSTAKLHGVDRRRRRQESGVQQSVHQLHEVHQRSSRYVSGATGPSNTSWAASLGQRGDTPSSADDAPSAHIESYGTPSPSSVSRTWPMISPIMLHSLLLAAAEAGPFTGEHFRRATEQSNFARNNNVIWRGETSSYQHQQRLKFEAFSAENQLQFSNLITYTEKIPYEKLVQYLLKIAKVLMKSETNLYSIKFYNIL